MFKLTFPPETQDRVLEAYRQAGSILEYGSGGSTVFAASQPGKTVYAVESDREWLDRLVDHVAGQALPGNLVPVYADIGPTKEWGHPVDQSQAFKFPNYSLRPWQLLSAEDRDVDLVLIDGRFRVGCFLTSLACIRRPTRIIFDDYVERPRYHFVERFVEPADFFGRAAVFDCEPGQITTREFCEFFHFLQDAA